MKDIKRRKYISMVDLSKFISSKKILSKIAVLYYNQFYNKTLSEGVGVVEILRAQDLHDWFSGSTKKREKGTRKQRVLVT